MLLVTFSRLEVLLKMTDPGLGYTDPPIVTFQDSCNKGYGAYGRAIIDEVPTSPTFGQITAVVITSEGVNYPAEIDELPLFIEEIIIEDPGNDIEAEEIEIEGVDLEIENGRVIRATPKPFAYNGLPTLNISGAILRPIMTTTPPPSEIIKVIDCISN